ncbi:MAG: SMI1/KNR4 family protein [Deltaproteobacteria bacterium]|nr:SMI1/KNR4 family protein [Deltaproteobacteria bacterium]
MRLNKYRQEHRLNNGIERKPTPSDWDIRDAEEALSLSFPGSYKLFVRQAGTCPLIFDEVFWIGSEGETYRDIVKVKKDTMGDGDLQEFLIPFYADGYGNYVCFDTRKDDAGEYVVVFWDHEEQLAERLDDLEVVADNFAAWFIQEVKEQIEEDQAIGEDEE